jgi:hypothetical protein
LTVSVTVCAAEEALSFRESRVEGWEDILKKSRGVCSLRGRGSRFGFESRGRSGVPGAGVEGIRAGEVSIVVN